MQYDFIDGCITKCYQGQWLLLLLGMFTKGDKYMHCSPAKAHAGQSTSMLPGESCEEPLNLPCL